MKLVRVKDLPKDFPIKLSTLYKWHHYGKYPKLLVKFGGLCLDMDEIENTVKRRDIPLRKVSK